MQLSKRAFIISLLLFPCLVPTLCKAGGLRDLILRAARRGQGPLGRPVVSYSNVPGHLTNQAQASVHSIFGDLSGVPMIQAGMREAVLNGTLHPGFEGLANGYIRLAGNHGRVSNNLAAITHDFEQFVRLNNFQSFEHAWIEYTSSWGQLNRYRPITISESLSTRDFARRFATVGGRPGLLVNDLFFNSTQTCGGFRDHGQLSHGLQMMIGHNLFGSRFRRIIEGIGNNQLMLRSGRMVEIQRGAVMVRSSGGVSFEMTPWSYLFDSVQIPSGLHDPIRCNRLICVPRDVFQR